MRGIQRSGSLVIVDVKGLRVTEVAPFVKRVSCRQIKIEVFVTVPLEPVDERPESLVSLGTARMP